jgi:transposase-like protein
MDKDNRLARARELLDGGLTHVAIARELGVSRSTLLRIFTSGGIRGVSGGKPTYSAENVKSATALYRAGEPMNAIGRLLGFTGPTIRVMLEKSGAISTAAQLIPRYSKAVREEALRLYSVDRLSAAGVARKLGLKPHTIKEWAAAAGVIRSMSDAACNSISAGKKRGRSYTHHLWQSEKAQGWVLADSVFEVVRMQQLDRDDSVVSWGLCKRFIPYTSPLTGKPRKYVPDIEITYIDGSLVIEEIKPSGLVADPINIAKAEAARQYLGKLGVAYKIVTEMEIGIEEIKSYRPQGVQVFAEEERLAREKLTRRAALARRLAAESPEQRKQRLESDAERARAYRKAKSERRINI